MKIYVQSRIENVTLWDLCVCARAQKHYAQSQIWSILANKYFVFCDGDFSCDRTLLNLHEFISTARAIFEQNLMLDHAYKPQKVQLWRRSTTA